MYVTETADIKVAGSAAIRLHIAGKPYLCRNTAPAHSTSMASVWLDQEKYRQRTLKSRLVAMNAPTASRGTDRAARLTTLDWSM